MQSKLRRNDLCWCGSGLKYKKCHKDRETASPVESWQVAQKLREHFSYKVCSAPDTLHHDCSGQIIRAHSVPRSSSLNAIAQNGHVLGLNTASGRVNSHQNPMRLSLIGVRSASTFSGFCNTHDTNIFAPLETETFTGTALQCFLLAYRAVAREHYGKVAAVKNTEFLLSLDKGRPLLEQIKLQKRARAHQFGSLLGLDNIQTHKTRFDEYIVSNNYDNVRSVIFHFGNAPPVMVSSSIFQDFDFNGRPIQNIANLAILPEMMSVSSFFDGKKGYVTFSWLKAPNKTAETLLESLLEKPRELIPIYLVQYIFNNFDNFYVAPTWWDTVSKHDKDTLNKLLYDIVRPDIAPHGRFISKPMISVGFPKIEDISFLNWSPETSSK